MRSLAAVMSAAAMVACTLGVMACAAAATADSTDPRALHHGILVLDSHVDILMASSPHFYYLPDGGSRASVDRLIKGGVDALVLSVFVGTGPETPEGYAAGRHEADERLAAIKDFVAKSGGRVEFARSAGDVERLHRQGHIAVILGLLNAYSLGADLKNFDYFYQAGVRVAGLTHAGHNAFADSSRPIDGVTERHHGLSPLGRDAVRRFNDLGVLIDVSQLSSAALKQTLELTRAPVVASHSDARALVDNTRNLTDEELDAIKANGGVVQLTPFGNYVLKRPPGIAPAVQDLRAKYGLPREAKADAEGGNTLPPAQTEQFYRELGDLEPHATLQNYIDQIDYVVKRIGADHVGIGTDFNHGAGVIGFNDESEAPNVTAELVKRGYSRDQIAAIWGGNFLRVLRAAQSKAAKGST